MNHLLSKEHVAKLMKNISFPIPLYAQPLHFYKKILVSHTSMIFQKFQPPVNKGRRESSHHEEQVYVVTTDSITLKTFLGLGYLFSEDGIVQLFKGFFVHQVFKFEAITPLDLIKCEYLCSVDTSKFKSWQILQINILLTSQSR